MLGVNIEKTNARFIGSLSFYKVIFSQYLDKSQISDTPLGLDWSEDGANVYTVFAIISARALTKLFRLMSLRFLIIS